MLMSVPENLTSFDGTMTAEDGTSLEINAIAEQAFSDCQDLEWVTLPESIKKIGYKAFEDCIGLQGILSILPIRSQLEMRRFADVTVCDLWNPMRGRASGKMLRAADF